MVDKEKSGRICGGKRRGFVCENMMEENKF
jgi:hypothetical protein